MRTEEGVADVEGEAQPGGARAAGEALERAMRRVRAVWVSTGAAAGGRAEGAGGATAAPPRLVWCWWQDGAAWVLTGPGEQQLDVRDGEALLVTTRTLSWPAHAALVSPGAPRWDELAAALPRVRLNPPDGLAAAQQRWGRCRLVGLVPAAGY